MSKEYFFISDLHIGGSGEINKCDFEEELIFFLNKLSKDSILKNIELIIVGDLFGLWEVTHLKGIDKLYYILETHKRLFNEFKLAGGKFKITLIPGNHDQELLVDINYKTILKKYNIILEMKEKIVRKIGNKKIWIEHGHQNDDFNKFPKYNTSQYYPRGYYIIHDLISSRNDFSMKKEKGWIRDLISVSPTEDIPSWMFSNYFYKQMNPILRFIFIPFMIFFIFSAIMISGFLLEYLKIIKTNFFGIDTIKLIIPFNNYLYQVIIADITLVLSIILLMIPLFVIFRDLKVTLRRFGLVSNNKLKKAKNAYYMDLISKTIKDNPDISIYIFGHTHEVNFIKLKNCVILNTGTWIKLLRRVKTYIRFLPAVYYPYYNLGYYKVSLVSKSKSKSNANNLKESYVVDSKEDKVMISYYQIPKKNKFRDLTFFQKLFIFNKHLVLKHKIPKKIILE